ncbi:MAG: putative metal-binding motif-containing protein [Patescibacteria group bacterium]
MKNVALVVGFLLVAGMVFFFFGCGAYGEDDDSTDSTATPGECVEGETEELADLWHPDRDTDGFGAEDGVILSCTQPVGYVADNTDCDDADATVYPGATEVCDGKDNDCDGAIDEGFDTDADADGYTVCTDCDDDDPAVGDPPTWYEDADDDGYTQPFNGVKSCTRPEEGWVIGSEEADCNKGDASVYPGAPEIYDGKDNDCDGEIDEG